RQAPPSCGCGRRRWTRPPPAQQSTIFSVVTLALAGRKPPCYSGLAASRGGRGPHEATADRIPSRAPLGRGDARARWTSCRPRTGPGDAPDEGRSFAAAELQHPDRAGKVAERRDVDLRAAQAHEPVPGQGRPGEGLPAADLRMPRG